MSIKAYLDESAVAKGCTLFTGKVQCYVAIKLEGSTCLAYTFSEKGINIWVREKLCDGIVSDYKLTDHTFGARIFIQEDTPETRILIEKLLDSSIEHQKKIIELKSFILKFKK